MSDAESVEDRPMTKLHLVAELSELAGVSKVKAAKVIDALAYVTYREAHKGLVLPGICKVEVAHRKERTCRNPRTGQLYRIAERDVVRIRPVKKAKDLITPPVEGLVTPIDAPAAVVPAAAAPQVAAATAEPEIAFACRGCGAEILAPGASAGQSASCPACGQLLTVPAPAGAPVAVHTAAATLRSEAPPGTAVSPEPFVLFSCPECRQDIEAPRSAAGSRGECPSCGAALTVPRLSAKGIARAPLPAAIAAARKTDMKSLMSQTIRIELPGM